MSSRVIHSVFGAGAVFAVLWAFGATARADPLTHISVYGGFLPYTNAGDFGVPDGPLLGAYTVPDVTDTNWAHPLGLTDFSVIMEIPYYSDSPVAGSFFGVTSGWGTYTLRDSSGGVTYWKFHDDEHASGPINLLPGYGVLEVRYAPEPGMGMAFGLRRQFAGYAGEPSSRYMAYAYADSRRPVLPDGGDTATLLGLALGALACARGRRPSRVEPAHGLQSSHG